MASIVAEVIASRPKRAIANGCFFNIGARLARYTGNSTYGDWAETTWDWLFSVGFVDPDTYEVYDGAHVQANCTDINKAEFSYNCAVLAQGAAYMYSYVSFTTRVPVDCFDTYAYSSLLDRLTTPTYGKNAPPT